MSGKGVREVVGFAGVVASLVFVGVEIRQNTVTARAAAYQAMGEAVSDSWIGVSDDPVKAELMMRFFQDEDAAFTPNEEAVLVAMTVGNLRLFETAWRQVELGLLPPQALEQMGWGSPQDVPAFQRNISLLWPKIAPMLSSDFRDFIEESRGY